MTKHELTETLAPVMAGYGYTFADGRWHHEHLNRIFHRSPEFVQRAIILELLNMGVTPKDRIEVEIEQSLRERIAQL